MYTAFSEGKEEFLIDTFPKCERCANTIDSSCAGFLPSRNYEIEQLEEILYISDSHTAPVNLMRNHFES